MHGHDGDDADDDAADNDEDDADKGGGDDQISLSTGYMNAQSKNSGLQGDPKKCIACPRTLTLAYSCSKKWIPADVASLLFQSRRMRRVTSGVIPVPYCCITSA